MIRPPFGPAGRHRPELAGGHTACRNDVFNLMCARKSPPVATGGLGDSHFLNMAFVRSPRDSAYAIRSRISSSLNVSNNPAGIIESFDCFIDSMLLRSMDTDRPGSSM